MTINTKESGCMGWLVALGILFLIGKGCGDDETDLGKDSYRSSSASYLYRDTMRHTDTSSLDTWPGNENRRYQSIGPTKHRPHRIPAAEHHYIRGPRGGCYYINSHGNKVYVDRSLCN